MGGHKELEEGVAVKLDWNKLDKVASKKCDVVPVVVQDTATGAVLIAAYVNEVALQETLKRRVCCLWSTSRNELWVKGATSGDTLDLDEIRINCEQNSLLYLVTPRNVGACHTKGADGVSRISCYYRALEQLPDGTLALSHADIYSAPRCLPCPPESDPPAPRRKRVVTMVAIAAAAAVVGSIVAARFSSR